MRTRAAPHTSSSFTNRVMVPRTSVRRRTSTLSTNRRMRRMPRPRSSVSAGASSGASSKPQPQSSTSITTRSRYARTLSTQPEAQAWSYALPSASLAASSPRRSVPRSSWASRREAPRRDADTCPDVQLLLVPGCSCSNAAAPPGRAPGWAGDPPRSHAECR